MSQVGRETLLDEATRPESGPQHVEALDELIRWLPGASRVPGLGLYTCPTGGKENPSIFEGN
jgi:hypothetical protein